MVASMEQLALTRSVAPPLVISGRLRDRVGLTVANLKEATEVIVKNHYLHRGRTMAQMPYWVCLDGERVGVLLYALPRMSVKFQGYSPMALIELARMWLDPSVQGSVVTGSDGQEHAFSVATCAVGASLRRIRQDWHGKYPHLPIIEACVSWADEVHHEGTIYKASNFTEVGRSGGALHGRAQRPNGGRDQAHADYLHTKKAYIFRWPKPVNGKVLLAAEEEWSSIRPKRPAKKRNAEGEASLLTLL
jgi:hypothetical protein